MRICILTNGSRGDVQPFLALATGLKKSSCEATLAAPPGFEQLIREYDVDFAPLEDQSPGENAIQPTNGIQRIIRKAAMVEQVLEQAFLVSQNADAIIFRGGSFLTYPAYSIAQKLAIPCFEASLLPLIPTRKYPNIYLSNRTDLPGWVNYFSHILFRRLTWQAFRIPINRFRRNRLGMRAITWFPGEFHQLATLLGFSETILPKPDDWPKNAHVTGYWVLEPSPNWSPPLDLEEFLADGTPPLYLGFGSMENNLSAAFWSPVMDALETKGLRVLLAGEPAQIPADFKLSKRFFPLKDTPHEWIFPRTAAVVHHGGAGTTAASFRAGIPAVILPHHFDQPFWGQMVHQLGAGPKPIPIREISGEKMIEAIDRCIGDSEIRRNAAEIGRRLQTENGVAKAVAQIHKLLFKNY